jgi:hypothetical protein
LTKTERSSQNISEIMQKQSNVNQALSMGTNLVNQSQNREKIDKLLLYMAVTAFFLAVIYVVYSRGRAKTQNFAEFIWKIVEFFFGFFMSSSTPTLASEL